VCMKKTLSWLAVILLPVVVIGGIRAMSRDMSRRNLEWPTQMQYSPAYASQSPNPILPNGMTQQMPVPGTLPRGFQPFRYGAGPEEAERAGRELSNPIELTEANLARGQQVYSNQCAVCHGATGAGDGPLIPKYPNPPSYNTDKSKALADGNMFHAITVGRNNMPSHAAQVAPDDRWKVILYIRRLQGKL
ncbi:MAG TPA: cytochrome c, partial [Blastocatellia bacterium]|nr:cytochrome c [Blastocatellia bacterium]